MNKERRASLRKALRMLNSAKDIVEIACDEENDCLDNVPENIRCADRYSDMEDSIGHMEDAITNIEDAIDELEGVLLP